LENFTDHSKSIIIENLIEIAPHIFTWFGHFRTNFPYA